MPTAKLSGLLTAAPTVTVTGPVTAPNGACASICPSDHDAITAGGTATAFQKVIVSFTAPKFSPKSESASPSGPLFGKSLHSWGPGIPATTVKFFGARSDVVSVSPRLVRTCSNPVGAPDGTFTIICASDHTLSAQTSGNAKSPSTAPPAGLQMLPLQKKTVPLAPLLTRNPDPVMVTYDPFGPDCLSKLKITGPPTPEVTSKGNALE